MVYVQRLLIIYRYEYEKEIECETLFYEEFDPSSGWTLAERLTHASQTASNGSGKRASNAYLTCPEVVNNHRDMANPR